MAISWHNHGIIMVSMPISWENPGKIVGKSLENSTRGLSGSADPAAWTSCRIAPELRGNPRKHWQMASWYAAQPVKQPMRLRHRHHFYRPWIVTWEQIDKTLIKFPKVSPRFPMVVWSLVLIFHHSPQFFALEGCFPFIIS